MIAAARSSHLPWGGTRLALSLVALLFTAVLGLAASFPALTGRIVDQANVIPAETRSTIEPKLSELESKSGIQLVVATVPRSRARVNLTPMSCSQLEARRRQEQRRVAARRPAAPRPHRSRLRSRHAHRRADQGHHHEYHRAALQTGDFAGGIARSVMTSSRSSTDASEWQSAPRCGSIVTRHAIQLLAADRRRSRSSRC